MICCLPQAVPYWVDDESVRPSMLLSAPPAPRRQPDAPESSAAAANGQHTTIEVQEDVSQLTAISLWRLYNREHT